MPQGPRAFDHLVLAVRDLDAAAAFYKRLGFTVTPRGIHPWGTHNRLVQFAQHTFFELLTVAEPEKIVEAGPGAFSFGAFNRDALAAGEGMSMLVLASRDAAADRADFAAHGLPTYAPFGFERMARAPDESERKVGFDLTFTSDPALPHAGFFTCAQRAPDLFWKPDFMSHDNGATGVAAVTMVARDPSDHHDFLQKFTGRRDSHATSAGLTLELANGVLDVLTPAAFAHRFGADVPETEDARFRAVTVTVRALGAVRDAFIRYAIPHSIHGARLVVPAAAAFGVTLAFVS